MTQLGRHPSFLLIADRLEAVMQRYRLWLLVRGMMLWLGFGIVATLATMLAAHGLGQGWLTLGVVVIWAGWMIVSGVRWVVHPLLIRPRLLEVAELVERRVDGLHNGLTNTLLLADAPELQNSPFIPAIFDEVLTTSRHQPLDEAVRFAELRPVGLKLTVTLMIALLVAFLLPGALAHGWRQMLAPVSFVNRVGVMNIQQVAPGNVTLVAGQPLEIAITASGPDQPQAKLIFDHTLPDALLTPAVGAEGVLSYSYRAEFIASSLRYRVEVGASQSPWYTVTVVPQVKLTELRLEVTPPGYTQLPGQTIRIDTRDTASTPITVVQGSRIELTAGIDLAMGGAMLQLGQTDQPRIMKMASGGTVFTAGFDINQPTSLQVLLMSAMGQITAALPDQPLMIGCTPDAPPTLEMKWPGQDASVAPDAPLNLAAVVGDDHGLSSARILMASSADAPLAVVHEQRLSGRSATLAQVLDVPPTSRRHGQSVRVQVEVSDNRDISAESRPPAYGPDGSFQRGVDDPVTSGALTSQTTRSAIFEIRFRDPEQIAAEYKQQADQLRARLREMLKLQQDLLNQTMTIAPDQPQALAVIGQGQGSLQTMMIQTAEHFEFDQATRQVQKTLQVLAYGLAKDATDLPASIIEELVVEQRRGLLHELVNRQQRIVSTLQSLLAMLDVLPDPLAEQSGSKGGDLKARAAFEKLNEALKEFIAQQQRILDQSAALAKKPVDNWDDADKKLKEELLQSQEKLDAFLQQKISDFSKMAEQDMANSSLLKELLEVYSEVTMAKNALQKDPIELAVSLEESSLELASEIQSNLEKWLMDEPDRIKWTMEDPVEKVDTPMPELPDQLEDLIGELMEEQEDLFDEIEDTNANWTDSLDKGAGWDTADGPIANMSAKGVTGNQLPNNNEMGGRAGEGRSGRSQGEFVEETATGKGGRNTPTRLDPTAFEQGQIKDVSTDPVGGATGGGKLSGQGGQGLEGPVPSSQHQAQMERLRQKQAQLRNRAERLNLQYRVGRYDQFKLLNSIALMRRVESDLQANRYQTALRRKDVLLNSLDTSRLLVEGQIHVEHDTTPSLARRVDDEIRDTMQGSLPPAWQGALKTYYEKLGQE
ncbi:MAG: hypothetical protein IT448_08750 [Phycisphaerales bacterium]|nr:hypothetical protein [Phycisphaerales bacterium]